SKTGPFHLRLTMASVATPWQVPAMQRLLFITHPEVVVDPAMRVTDWRLSDSGLARMRAFCDGPEARGVGAVWASSERKSLQAASLLTESQGLGVQVDPDLGENDRSATGYLAHAEFERVADAFLRIR